MEDLARRIAQLTPERRAILERHLLAAAPVAVDRVPPRADRMGPARLSFAQERLWFIDQLEPGSASYNLSLPLPLEGNPAVDLVQGAWRDLGARHAMLRTAIEMAEGRPVQIEAAEAPSLRVRDVVGAALNDAIRAEMTAPFDLTAGPPVRATLLRAGGRAAALVITLHHILSDGWSNAILAREFAALLEARRAGTSPQLPPLTIDYADYAEWQRTRLAGAEGEALMAHWRDTLAGAPQLLTLPSDPSGAGLGQAGATFSMPLAFGASTHALGKAENATRFMVLLAGFFALLHRAGGQGDLLVGTPVANRDRVELEPLVGLFVNTLALRARIDRGTTFRALVRAVRATVLDAHAHQELPFEQLVAQLVGARDTARPPLVQLLFALEKGSVAEAPETVASGSRAKFDLTLTVLESGEALGARWDYDAAVLDGATVERLARAYAELLGAALAHPDRRISDYPLLAPEARAQAIADGVGPVLAAAPTETLFAGFAAQAARTPDAIALVHDGGSLSYAALLAQAEAAAAMLHARGVRAGARVGICLARSPAMIVGILAALRLGAAYVPLDPAYPDARLVFMARDAGLALILADASEHARLASIAVPVEFPEALAGDVVQGTRPIGSAAAVDTAYVIYTSGSTGQPKGVAVSHRAIVNQMQWLQARWPLGIGDRLLQRTTFSFDASVWEIFAPLLAGATLVLPSTDRSGFVDLGSEIRRCAVSVVQLVPSLLRALLDTGALGACPTLKLLFCGGERLASDLAAQAAATTGAKVVNLYGPTEAAVNAVAHVAEAQDLGAAVPIGRPIANLQAHLLDESMEPVVPGMVGELYLGGTGLADFYVGQPARTAASFVPDPFATAPGARLYRTGDRARRRRDGLLEFHGRADRQCKLRGFRVEPGETEAALRQLPTIADALVDIEADRLVAWIVPRESCDVSAEETRAALAARLPEHLIPSRFMPIAAIPLLPNGKTDRAALPLPADDAPKAAAAPRGDTERRIAAIWQAVLGGGAVGRDQDFFAIGGHSLLAVQLVSRIKDQFGIALPLRQIFETPTVAGLARHLDTLADADAQSRAERVERLPEPEIDALLAALTGASAAPAQREHVA